MAFSRNLLTKDEKLVLELKPHPVMLVLPVLATLVTAGVVAWLVSVIPSSWSVHGVLVWILAIGGSLVLVLYPGRRAIAWLTTYFVVTSDRVIHRSGLIAKESMEIPLEAINDVRFTQSVFERVIGSGDLIIESAGTRGSEVFEHIRHPENVQKTIYEVGERNKERMYSGGRAAEDPSSSAVTTSGPQPGGAVGSPTDELAKLADLHDRGALTEAEFQAQKARLLGGSGTDSSASAGNAG